MKKYIAIEEPKNGIGTALEKFFDSPEDAANEARSIWNHLTSGEKGKTRVSSAMITEDDLNPEAWDEINLSDTDPACSDCVCWGLYHTLHDYPGRFDSDEE